MAKGKQAALSANRRYEAATQHLDRVTDALADAKMRAKRHEHAAARLPLVEQELAEARRQLAEVTSPEVERLQAEIARLTERNLAMRDHVTTIQKLWDTFLVKTTDANWGHIPGFDRLEQALAAVSDDKDEAVVVVDNMAHMGGIPKQDRIVAAQRIQRARGERRRVVDKGQLVGKDDPSPRTHGDEHGDVGLDLEEAWPS